MDDTNRLMYRQNYIDTFSVYDTRESCYPIIEKHKDI